MLGALVFNKYVMGALAGAAVLAGVWFHGYSTAKGACQTKVLRAQVKSLQHQIDVQDKALSEHKVRLREDAAKMAEFNRKVTELQDYVDKIPDSECLSADDVKRLQFVIGSGKN